MRVLILSDTHGRLDHRIAAIAASCDWVLHGGDIGNIAVLRTLHPRIRVLAVRGNNDSHDKWPADERAELETLPWVATCDLPGGQIAVVHGHRVAPASRRHERLRQQFPAARAVVYGHSHHLALDTTAQPWVLNPGAAGRERTFGGPSCILLTADPTGWTLEPLRFTLADQSSDTRDGTCPSA
ncbi:MAG: metallophosphoesterase family protein [Thiotrichales bacterium]